MQNIVDDLKAIRSVAPEKGKTNPWVYVAMLLFLVIVAGAVAVGVRYFGISISTVEPVSTSAAQPVHAPVSNPGSSNQAEMKPTAAPVQSVDTGAVLIPPASDEYQQVIAAQADHSPRGNPNQGVVTGAEVVVDTSADVQVEAPAVVEVAPVVEAVAVSVPTVSAAIAASYTSRTQDRCSMPRANPATCKQPMPAMVAPVGNTP